MTGSPDAVRIGTALRTAMDRLGGEASARVDAEVLLAFALDRDRAWLIAHRDDVLQFAQHDAYLQLIELRVAGQPVAYLVGSRGFWNQVLTVGPGVLIPRPETELLVELALARIPSARSVQIADLGTGAGTIALVLACERSRSRICAVDVSIEALRIADANARRMRLENVCFVQGHWLDAFVPEPRFDLIVSNPPYLAEKDPHLDVGDLRFEPRIALVSGADGLDAIQEIAASARQLLRPGGALLFEHGTSQGLAARDILAAAGFSGVETWQDLGARDRVSGGVSAD